MIKIFVEGVTDVKLLRDFITHTYGKLVEESLFVRTSGYGALFNEQNLNQLKFVNDQGGSNLVIFDADGNFIERQNELLDKADEYEIDVKLFLFPNNADTGDREKLLQKIARPDKYNLFASCFDPYMSCLIAYNQQYIAAGNPSLNSLPNRKVAINNYLRLYGQEANERKRDYTNQDFWDLSHEYIQPLNDFLRPFFT